MSIPKPGPSGTRKFMAASVWKGVFKIPVFNGFGFSSDSMAMVLVMDAAACRLAANRMAEPKQCSEIFKQKK